LHLFLPPFFPPPSLIRLKRGIGIGKGDDQLND
jgi:hypothetical protein